MVLRHRLDRMRRLPRKKAGYACLLEQRFIYPDAASFVSTYESIINHRCYHFHTNMTAPRILDCGANTGMATLYFKKIYPAARITAFEPDPTIAGYLRENLKLGGINDVDVVEAAVWKSEGGMTFLPDGADGGALVASGKGISVKTIDILKWMDAPIDLLKMDIEGAEMEVLEHCEKQLTNVQNIAVEYHERLGEPQYLDQLLSLISKAGFKYHVFSKGAAVKPLANRFGPGGAPQMLDIFARRA
jgi:FkbM family methyltransferase